MRGDLALFDWPLLVKPTGRYSAKGALRQIAKQFSRNIPKANAIDTEMSFDGEEPRTHLPSEKGEPVRRARSRKSASSDRPIGAAASGRAHGRESPGRLTCASHYRISRLEHRRRVSPGGEARSRSGVGGIGTASSWRECQRRSSTTSESRRPNAGRRSTSLSGAGDGRQGSPKDRILAEEAEGARGFARTRSTLELRRTRLEMLDARAVCGER
jgi:hypothetical protein